MKKLPKRFFKRKININVPPIRKAKFPNIFLIIPEIHLFQAFLHPVFLYILLCGFLFTTIIILAFQSKVNFQELQHQIQQKQTIEQEITFWKQAVGQYRDYRDGFYKLAVLEYRIGNNRAAYEYIQKVLVLDPGFSDGEALASKIAE